MRLGFDSKRLFANHTGLGNYSRNLIKSLIQRSPENTYYLYTPKHSENIPQCLNNHNIKIITKNHFLSFIWRSFSIVKILKKDNIDIYHGLSNELPFGIKKSGIKSVVTIHDLIFKHYPKTYPLIDRIIYNIKSKYACKKSDKIIAVSESTKKDIIKFYDIEDSKIKVIYQAINPIFFEKRNNIDEKQVLKSLNIPNHYFLIVGSIEQRKNHITLIKSYQHLEEKNQLPLVIVGKSKKRYIKKILKEIQKQSLENKIIWLESLKSNYQLKVLYGNARIMIYPSIYEGFGLPVSEAILCKTPVIASNCSSIPEAGGPKTLYVNPLSSKAIAEAITGIMAKPKEVINQMVEINYDYMIKKIDGKQLTQQMKKIYTELYN